MSDTPAPDDGAHLRTCAVDPSLASIDHPEPPFALAIAANTVIHLFGRIEEIVRSAPTDTVLADADPAISLIARRLGRMMDVVARLRESRER